MEVPTCMNLAGILKALIKNLINNLARTAFTYIWQYNLIVISSNVMPALLAGLVNFLSFERCCFHAKQISKCFLFYFYKCN